MLEASRATKVSASTTQGVKVSSKSHAEESAIASEAVDGDIGVRSMREGEEAAVRRVMRRAFPPPAWLIFSLSQDVLVAERAGRIVGGVVLDLFSIRNGLQVGFVSWIFTDPDVQGLGAGQALTEAALEVFTARGVDEISACVEGYNTSSSKLFSTRGFSILSLGEQLRRYGWGIFRYWWHAWHFVDVGHFLWARPGEVRLDSPWLQWWGTWLANVGMVWLAFARRQAFQAFDVELLWVAPLALLTLFGLRTLAMWAAAKAQGLEVRYRAWESSAPLALGIAAVFGGLFLFPGSFYPPGDRWTYRDVLPKLGLMALAGSLATLMCGWGAWAAFYLGIVSPALASPLASLANLGAYLGLFDTLIAFFPFVSFNGRRLWDWNRLAWAALSLVAVALWFAPSG